MRNFTLVCLCGVVLALAISGCGGSSSANNDPVLPNQPRSAGPADPQKDVARAHSIDGKWITACVPATNGRSLSWSLEFAGQTIASTEYVFADGACQSLMSSKGDTGFVDVESAIDGTDAKFTQLGRDRVVVASYYDSLDRVYFHVRGGIEFSHYRLNENSDGAREFSRAAFFPAFAPVASRLSSSADFGTVQNQKLTYIGQVIFGDKRDQKLLPYDIDISRELIQLETVIRNGRLDVHQTATASNNSDFYWSEMGSQPEVFVNRARAHSDITLCKAGTIQMVPSPLGAVEACVTDQLPKVKTVYSRSPAYLGLFTEYEFQDDQNFHIVHGYELLGANW